MKNYWKFALVGFFIAAVAVAYLAVPRRMPAPILPVPNGYDDFRKAAQQVASLEQRNDGDATDEELRDLVNENRSALGQARAGFEHQSRVTTDYTVSPAVYAAQHMPVLAGFKKLALAFRAEGDMAQREGKTNSAVQAYLDGIRFGQEIGRGGLLIDRMVGTACERMSLDQLQALVPELDAATCRKSARTLEQLDAGRDSMQAVLDEEQRWAMATAGWRERIVLLLRPNAVKAARDNAARKVVETQGRERRIMLELAGRAYALEHGKSAPQASELVPDYLSVIPKNPVNERAIELAPEGLKRVSPGQPHGNRRRQDATLQP